VPLFEITESGLRRHESAGFAPLGLRERQDLQRLLREQIGALDEDLLIISEEFGNWEDARRRIDLLAIDRDGHLVVIELKRTEDGGHMDLQALRYAAMVSSMTFDDAVAAYGEFLSRTRPDEPSDPKAGLIAFLGYEDDDEPDISEDVRIILVSADFGREITTAVLWLNRFEGMDIRCVRLVPYSLDGKVMLDIQQIVPLPEAADYQVRVRRKAQERERARTDGRDFTRFSITVDGVALPDENKRNAVRTMVARLIERGVDPAEIAEILGRKFRDAEGELTNADEIQSRMELDGPRWYLDQPFHCDGRTWVLSKMWGKATEETLDTLSRAFPAAGIGFERAE
jgi:hypothetical protein